MIDTNLLDAWNISPVDYPREGSLRAQLTYLVHYAILAPSSHNTQPWLFEINDDSITLRADRTRALPVIDPLGRQLAMSCGAALFNLRIAARRFGHVDEVALLPDPGNPGLIATLRFGRPGTPTPRELSLFDAIPQRHTNRQPFEIRPIGYQIADDMAKVAASEEAWLLRLVPQAKVEVAEMIAAADKCQFQDKHFRRELADWLATGRSHRRDGIPTEVKDESTLMNAPMLVRTFDIGSQVAATERELATGSPMLAILGTHGDTIVDWVQAGQAMQHVLLLGRTHGISASFLNQAIELDTFREQLKRFIGDRGFPQLVLRLGYGPLTQPTPRRQPGDVIIQTTSQ